MSGETRDPAGLQAEWEAKGGATPHGGKQLRFEEVAHEGEQTRAAGSGARRSTRPRRSDESTELGGEYPGATEGGSRASSKRFGAKAAEAERLAVAEERLGRSSVYIQDLTGPDWIKPDPRRDRTPAGAAGFRVRLTFEGVCAAIHGARVATLPAYIEEAVERNNQELAHGFGKGGRGGRHRSASWRVAQILRGHPLLAGTPGWEAAELVGRCLGPGGWERLPQSDVWGNDADPRADFIAAWGRVEHARFYAPHPNQALPLAHRHPLEGDHCVPVDGTYLRVASFVYWFSRLLEEDGFFFLACRTLGAALGVSHVIASAHLNRAVAEGLLEAVEKGRLKRATRYHCRYDVVEHAEVTPAMKSRRGG